MVRRVLQLASSDKQSVTSDNSPMPEFDFIDWLKKQTADDPRIVVPLGDDLAAMTWQAEDLLLIGVDQVLDGVHFDSKMHAPREVGRKVMNRNLSDCAAMACLPAAAVVTMALPRGVGEAYAQDLYMGLRDAADPFDCPVLGGDTASWAGKLVVTVTILGRSAGITPLERRGAKPGDLLYVTGPLGGSLLGRHMTFSPRVRQARELAEIGRVTAMVDLSDGLSRDATNLSRMSRVRIVIDAARVPIHDDAKEMATRTGKRPLDHALHDGEDYELLFTASGTDAIEGAKRIGRVMEGSGVTLENDGEARSLSPQGWEHHL
jgi:thiamine-monophosphate kinase